MAATGSGHGTKPCSGDGDGDGRLPEELAIEILKRLRSRRSVGRSRCVSKSWHRLLSDPNIIRDILFFDNQIESAAQILITRSSQEHHPEFVRGRGSGGRASAPTIYSQLSYHTLQPTIPAAQFPDVLISPTIAGCCHGIFCIYSNKHIHDRRRIMLWNPTTSETKILPPLLLPSNILGHTRHRQPYIGMVGFGFDPITNDYKVVAVTSSRASSSAAYVYTDSWRRPKSYGSFRDDGPPTISCQQHVIHVAQSHSPNLHRKCHWAIRNQLHSIDRFLTLASFDMSDEKFKAIRLRVPGDDDADRRLLSVSIVKESLVGIVSPGKSFESMHCSYQIWAALDYDELGSRCSWIKLFAVSGLPEYSSKLFYGVPALWKQGRCFVVGGDEKLRVVDPRVAEDRYRLAIEAKWYSFQVVTYVPSTISLMSS